MLCWRCFWVCYHKDQCWQSYTFWSWDQRVNLHDIIFFGTVQFYTHAIVKMSCRCWQLIQPFLDIRFPLQVNLKTKRELKYRNWHPVNASSSPYWRALTWQMSCQNHWILGILVNKLMHTSPCRCSSTKQKRLLWSLFWQFFLHSVRFGVKSQEFWTFFWMFGFLSSSLSLDQGIRSF